MKKFQLLLLATVFLSAFNSCNKNEPNNNNNNNTAPGGSWSASVNGQQKTGDSTGVTAAYEMGSKSLTVVLQPNVNTQYPTIELALQDQSAGITTTIYNLDTVGGAITAFYYKNNVGDYSPGHGQIHITSFNVSTATVSGTFYFTGFYYANAVNYANLSDSVVVTSGTFSCIGGMTIIQ